MNTDDYTGHTPGPWTFELYGDEGTIFATDLMVPEAEGTSICAMHELNQSPEQLGANGNLIAAAPELLAIVKQVQELAREATDPNGQGGKGGDTMRKIARILGVIE